MRTLRDGTGQSLVELALALPVVTFLLLGGADMARAYAVQLAVQNGARAGAEAAAVDQSPSAGKAVARATDEIARTPGLVSGSATVNATFAKADGASACANPPTVLDPCFATVRVRYEFRTITPWPLIPNVFQLDRTTTMRMFSTPS